MFRPGHARWLFFLSLCLVPVSSAFSETIEFVTYYPTSSETSQDRIHVGRATVGDPYSMADPVDANLPNGTLLVADRLGIAADLPAGPLHVIGRDDASEVALFLPGVDTAAAGSPSLNIGIGTASPFATLHIRPDGLFLEGRNEGSDGPRISMSAPQVSGGDVNTAPIWCIDNSLDRFRIFRQPNPMTAGKEAMTIVGVAPFDADGNTLDYRVGIGSILPFMVPPPSTLHVNGSLGLRTTTIAANTTLDITHNVVLCNNAANITITLPPVAGCANRTYTIKKISNNAFTVTIDGNGAETIDGAATAVLAGWNQSMQIISNGTAWYVLSGGSGAASGGGLVLLDEQDASNSASVVLTGFDARYKKYVIELINVRPSVSVRHLLMQVSTNGGSSWGTNYSWGVFVTTNAGGTGATGSTSDSAIRLSYHPLPNNGIGGACYTIWLSNPSPATIRPTVYWVGTQARYDSGVYLNFVYGGGEYHANQWVNAVRFRFDSNNVWDGTFKLYGME